MAARHSIRPLAGILAVVSLTACNTLTPRERHVLEVGATVIAVGAIAAYEARHGHERSAAPAMCPPPSAIVGAVLRRPGGCP